MCIHIFMIKRTNLATNTTGAALRNAIANGMNRLAFDVDNNGQVTGGIFS